MFAFAAPNDIAVIVSFAFAAGVALIYSSNVATRVSGVLVCVATMLAMSRPPGDSDNWLISLGHGAGAVVLLAVFRPKWLNRGKDADRDSDTT